MAELMLVTNPKKRGATRRRSPARKTARRKTYRRNPLNLRGMFNVRKIIDTAKTGATGALGAIAVDWTMAKLPLPAMLQTATMQPAMRGIVGVALGALVANVMKNRKLGEDIATGAVVVSVYGLAKTMLPQPAATMSGGNLLGFEDGLLGLGYFNPATVQRAPTYSGFQPAPTYESEPDDRMGYQGSPYWN